MTMQKDSLLEKWAPVLNAESVPAIADAHKRAIVAQVLENQEKAQRSEAAAASFGAMNETAANATGSGVAGWDPILISMVRRATPNLIAFDIAGVQPMSGPTGLIFAMKAKYSTQGGAEALHNEANTAFTGAGTHAEDSSSLGGTDTTPADTVNDAFDFGTGLATADAEALGNTGGAWAEMAFSIEKATATAKSRALKAEYSTELAQDLKNVHGLDAESELANILSTEVLGEINREMIRTVNSRAILGCTTTTTAGTFDMLTDADGRWSQEKFKGLVVQIEREANAIAKATRRGKGNFVICSSDVATVLAASGHMNFEGAGAIDDTGNTYVGMLSGRIKVFIDPFATVDYVTVGYRGSNAYDAGMFYCPYVPLTMMKTIGENDFQPKIGFKTRYGMVANPFASAVPGDDTGAVRSNPYFRIFAVANLLKS